MFIWCHMPFICGKDMEQILRHNCPELATASSPIHAHQYQTSFTRCGYRSSSWKNYAKGTFNDPQVKAKCEYEGLAADSVWIEDFLVQLVVLVPKLHNQGVLHKDLMLGNLMMEDETNNLYPFVVGVLLGKLIIGSEWLPHHTFDRQRANRVDMYYYMMRAKGILWPEDLMKKHVPKSEQWRSVLEGLTQRKPAMRWGVRERTGAKFE
ncbi:hypothetical protein CEUSTIGMA_g9960.t1 [Chlamydomonas eustigma]|uniref:Protein kinase domain-containing protein n=1 Tax=Chlamydomonas eustigma TaxID=1157962 RepID=A0A250XHL8_9CHLO|nr:hypothetical protein CEUSTIGMA_g9960.t1 [Chlamydomonas eustigma]|eukprot:GAX82533.1 hypothetical protein CEUSTIGMA_g9960.t1 [Chlamydomonas eustigma]